MIFSLNFKYFIILIVIFLIIYWFQYVDNKKRCKKREGIYENIKLPLFMVSIIALILFWDVKEFFSTNLNKNIIIVPQTNNLDVYTTLPEW
jgi:hypothetical protein